MPTLAAPPLLGIATATGRMAGPLATATLEATAVCMVPNLIKNILAKEFDDSDLLLQCQLATQDGASTSKRISLSSLKPDLQAKFVQHVSYIGSRMLESCLL